MSKVYDWVIVGGGVAGISIGEILSRNPELSILLLEKNSKLAGETSGEFHEWYHMGSLYTLIPDNLKTLKFILGSIDDTIDYYSSFDNMNLIPTEQGMDLKSVPSQWFNLTNIEFRFKTRKLNIPWSLVTARSSILIEKIKSHDWLRRRLGTYETFSLSYSQISKELKSVIKCKDDRFIIVTPELTMNSEQLLADLVASMIYRGSEVITDQKVINILQDSLVTVQTEDREYKAKNILLTVGNHLKDFISDLQVKTSLAPISIVKDLPEGTKSFVNLDYNPSNCSNLIVKDNGYGMMGGYSYSNETAAINHIHQVEKFVSQTIPFTTDYRYLGKKTEYVLPGSNRNYLYHISQNRLVWTAIPGKFSLAFSLAPEFYRRVFHQNPLKYIRSVSTDQGLSYIETRAWKSHVNSEVVNG